MLLEGMGGTVILEQADGTVTQVEHVLWCMTAARPEQAALELSWPRTAPHDLKGAHVTIDGVRYRVDGRPEPASDTAHGCGYDMAVTVTTSYYRTEMALMETTGTERDQWGTTTPIYGEPMPAMARLDSKRDELRDDMGAKVWRRVVTFELEPGTWREGYTAFTYDGETYDVTSVKHAGEVVTIDGVRQLGQ